MLHQWPLCPSSLASIHCSSHATCLCLKFHKCSPWAPEWKGGMEKIHPLSLCSMLLLLLLQWLQRAPCKLWPAESKLNNMTDIDDSYIDQISGGAVFASSTRPVWVWNPSVFGRWGLHSFADKSTIHVRQIQSYGWDATSQQQGQLNVLTNAPRLVVCLLFNAKL